MSNDTDPQFLRKGLHGLTIENNLGTPSPESGESLVLWRARNILDRGRSSASSQENDKASSDSVVSSPDEGSDIGRIRNVVINPRYTK